MGRYGNFNPSYVGLGELLISPEMQAAMHEKARKIAEAAAASSPVGDEHDPHRGEYRASWEVHSGIREEPTRRAVGRVVNDRDYAAAVEFGTSRGQQGQYVLTRAIDAARE